MYCLYDLTPKRIKPINGRHHDEWDNNVNVSRPYRETRESILKIKYNNKYFICKISHAGM